MLHYSGKPDISQGNYSGKSHNTFNATGKWQQSWVVTIRGVTEYFDGHFKNNKMILMTANEKRPDGSSNIQKMTFYNLGPNKVRHQSSIDGGTTWKTDFESENRRKR